MVFFFLPSLAKLLVISRIHFSADQHTEGSFAKAPPSRTSCATQLIAPPTRRTTERNSVQSSTANSSEDGTTPGGRTPKWTVRRACLECQDDKSSLKLTWNHRPWLCCSQPDQDVCKLYCFAEGYDFFFALASKVHDGTPCNQDSSNVCIDGLCEVMLVNITWRGEEVVFLWMAFNCFPTESGLWPCSGVDSCARRLWCL